MSINEILTKANGASINVTIGLDDLRAWQREVVHEVLTTKEQAELSKKQEQYLSPDEVMAYLKVSRSTLTSWRKCGYLIPAKVGKFCKYKKSELDAILNKKIR